MCTHNINLFRSDDTIYSVSGVLDYSKNTLDEFQQRSVFFKYRVYFMQKK